jgi:mRNA interferase RelE/StbE
MYKLIFDEEAIKFLDKLPKEITKRIFKKIQDTKENPHHFFIKLKNRQEYKLRVGNYRIIADINDSKITIYIITIGHRKDIYKKI